MKRKKLLILGLTLAAIVVMVGRVSATGPWVSWLTADALIWGMDNGEIVIHNSNGTTTSPTVPSNRLDELENNAFLYIKGPTGKQALLGTHDDAGNEKQAGAGVTMNDAFLQNYRSGTSVFVKGTTGDVEITLGTPQ